MSGTAQPENPHPALRDLYPLLFGDVQRFVDPTEADLAMGKVHRALQIPEVLHMILLQLEPGSLHNVMQTCRVLFWPAASHMWKIANALSLNHLTKIVLGTYSSNEGPALSMSARWIRFELYAHLVKSLNVDSRILQDGSNAQLIQTLEDNVQKIAFVTRAPVLFPSLRSLCIVATTVEHVDAAFLFLSPTLEDIDIKCVHNPVIDTTVDDWSVTIASLLEMVPERAPSLRKFAFIFGTWAGAMHRDSMSRLVGSLKQLLSFKTDVHALWNDVLINLGCLPSLRDLSMTLRSKDGVTFNPVSMSETSFSSLRDLRLYRITPMMAGKLLLAIAAELESIELDMNDATFNEEILHSCLSALPTARLHTLGLSYNESEAKLDSSLLWTSFALVLRCKFMAHFHLDVHSSSPFDLRDRHLGAMGSAWPHLEKLQLHWFKRTEEGHSGLVDETGLTLAGLTLLTEKCANLCLVDLWTFHGVTIPPAPRLAARPQSHGVKLRVRLAPIENPEAVASYLSILWPKLTVSYGGVKFPDTEDTKRWNKVKSLLAGIQCFRMMQEGVDRAEDMSQSGIGTISSSTEL